MCHFITLVAPTADQAALDAIMAPHGRTARPIENPGVQAALLEGEHQYLTNRRECDCGTVLGREPDEDDAAAVQAAEARRLARKGWSEAKISRSLADGARAAARLEQCGDSLQLWADVIEDLQRSLALPHVGLLVHAYTGSLSEPFKVSRHKAPADLALPDALGAMAEDQLLVFSRRKSATPLPAL